MTTRTHRAIRLSARPSGVPGPEHFEMSTEETRAPGPGEVLIRVRHLSIDPAMRGWVSAAANYSEPVAIGEVMRSIAVGEVVESLHSAYELGDILCGMFGWREMAISDGSNVWFRHDPAHGSETRSLGLLGINGLTAFFALTDIGRPRAGETVVVSTAAGAVGSAVGQIAKAQGCRTVGIAGGPDKVARCREVFGYDAAIDHRAGDLGPALDAACPDGVDVYFDNTAGPIADAVIERLRVRARIVICGTAAIQSWDPWPSGPRLERHLLVKRASAQGFLLFDHAERFEEGRARLAEMLAAGALTDGEHILHGLDAARGAVAMLYAGENEGKLIVSL